MSFDRRDDGKQLFEYNYPGLVCAKSISVRVVLPSPRSFNEELGDEKVF